MGSVLPALNFGRIQAQQCSTECLTAVKPLWYKSNTSICCWWSARCACSNAQRECHMTQPTPTVTFHIAASQMSVVWARLTTFLLHARYAFLHTFHSGGHADIDIFDQHQRRLVRCALRVADAATPAPAPPGSPAQGGLAADLISLLHDLVQTPSPSAREHKASG